MSVLNRGRILSIEKLIPVNKRNDSNTNYIWYISAATTLSVCNKPNDVKTIYKYAIEQDLDKALDDSWQIKSLNPLQKKITLQFKEALVKSSCIGGIPKAINSLHSMTSACIAQPMESEEKEDRFKIRNTNEEFVRKSDYNNKKISVMERGFDHWNLLYNKVSNKIINNLNRSSPDLWYTILSSCYGSILSNDEVLSAPDTSLVVISSLVPQDVNSQLYGHLKGAINVGCDKAIVNSIQNLSLEISDWCGINLKNKCVRL